MRLSISKSKNSTIYYVADSHRKGKKVITKLVTKIGTHNELLAKGITNPLEYAKEYVNQCNMELKENIVTYTEKVDLKEELVSDSLISKSTLKNIGWIYLKNIYDQLGIDNFIKEIDSRAKYDINNIVRFLSISRILNPCSKKSTYESLDHYYGSNEYNLIDSYRVLELLSQNNEILQKNLFNSTKKIASLNTDIFYYDCTNYYFETEMEDEDLYDEDGDIIQWGLRKYGFSKEHRPNPIVEMGLFIDNNGIPVSFSLHPGNTNEQSTAIPLEKQMIKSFNHSSFIYCSDAGLGSYDIRFFNSLGGRHYLVTQSLKKIDEENSEYIFKDLNWKFVDGDDKVSLEQFKATIDKKLNNEQLSNEELKLLERDMIYKVFPITRDVPAKFIKDLGIKITGKLQMEEVIYITFSQKYYIFQKRIFNRQLESAKNLVDKNKDITRKGNTDPARLVNSLPVTNQGEIVKNSINTLNTDAIIREEKFHGFYALATNLDNNINELLAINAQRWKIEQSFRLLKTDFDARPAFVWNNEHIRGHFAVCYIALLIYRLLERKLIEKDSTYTFPSSAVIKTLNNLCVDDKTDDLYKATYTGSTILDALTKTFNIDFKKKYYRKKTFKDLFSN